MSVAVAEDIDALARIVTKMIERAPLPYGANSALDEAKAEWKRRGLPISDQAISRARIAARAAVEARKDRREAAEREADQLDRAEAEARRVETAEERAWTPPDINDPGYWLSGRLPNLLASMPFDPEAEDRPPTWLVKGLLPESGLGLLYGESQAGKSFLAAWIAMSVAWGLPVFGRRTRQAAVLYVAAEGGKSVARRLRVADARLKDAAAVDRFVSKGQREHTRAPVEIVHQAPNLSRDGDPDKLYRTIRQFVHDSAQKGFTRVLVLVDTWHASLGGADENSAADAGHALKPLKDAVEATGAFVLAVHHPGKSAEQGARGSSALLAAVDTSIELRVPGCSGPKPKPASALREATVVKQRDGESGGQFHFNLPVVPLGVDDDGDPVTTCVVEPASSPRVGDDGLTERDRAVIECVRLAAAEAGGTRGRMDVARKAFINRILQDGGKAAGAKAAWYRSLKTLREADRIACDDHDEWVWILGEPGEAAE